MHLFVYIYIKAAKREMYYAALRGCLLNNEVKETLVCQLFILHNKTLFMFIFLQLLLKLVL